MKSIFTNIMLLLLTASSLNAQDATTSNPQIKEIYSLIDNYSLAREKRDTTLLKRILMPDVDQLVSTGEWRTGIQASVQGMMQSSTSSPGSRTLTIEKIRFIGTQQAIADAKYEIQNTDGSLRKMWSTFVVVNQNGVWKIAAIRNMLPTQAR